LPGRPQLCLDRVFLGLQRPQGILGCQHIEISLGDTQDQILVGRSLSNVGCAGNEFRLLVGVPGADVYDGLGQRQGPQRTAVAAAVAQVRGAACVVQAGPGFGRDIGKQPGARLGNKLLVGAAAVAGCRIDGIALQRLFPHLEQVLGVSGQRARGKQECWQRAEPPPLGHRIRT
jgi:hypothetical protein